MMFDWFRSRCNSGSVSTVTSPRQLIIGDVAVYLRYFIGWMLPALIMFIKYKVLFITLY
jgi:hypothetical protein